MGSEHTEGADDSDWRLSATCTANWSAAAGSQFGGTVVYCERSRRIGAAISGAIMWLTEWPVSKQLLFNLLTAQIPAGVRCDYERLLDAVNSPRTFSSQSS